MYLAVTLGRSHMSVNDSHSRRQSGYSDAGHMSVAFDDYVVEMDDTLVEDDYIDDEYMYEDEILNPKDKKKDPKTVQVPAKEKRLGGKKAYKEYMDSMKNQKRQIPPNPEEIPLRHKIKKIFKNDHRYYSK